MRNLLLAPLFAVALVLAGCGDDSSTGPDASIAGTYELRTVNGQAVPTVLGTFGGVTYTVLSGRVMLNEDKTASYSLTLRTESNGTASEQTETETGTYARNGNAIVATWSDGSVQTFSLSGDSLTLSESGYVAVFRR